jgi:hypothetical protein
MPCCWATLHFYEQMSMCSWAVMSGCSSAHRVWADEHVLMSSYEWVLICSSRKFYRAYFNKIYSISSGLNGPYEQMSTCSWAWAHAQTLIRSDVALWPYLSDIGSSPRPPKSYSKLFTSTAVRVCQLLQLSKPSNNIYLLQKSVRSRILWLT